MSASAEITTMGAVRGRRIDWTPYLMGAGIGVLSWIVFAVADDPLGITTALSAVAGFAAMPFAGAAAVWHNSYWAQTVPSLSYGSIFLVGVILGALAASVAARQFHIETVPAAWRQRFGPSVAVRFAAAFIGGALEMYGARLAGGCASGHGISGTLQLALSSWVFTILMFGTAILVGSCLFGQSGSRR
ncbi:MAG: YeeE/YedE thiosulfate transporter family protein [Xanthobacteraceae bacterium]